MVNFKKEAFFLSYNGMISATYSTEHTYVSVENAISIKILQAFPP